MAPHSSTLAWKIPWTEEPGRLQSMGSLRVGHDWATSVSLFAFMHWRRKWQPTPVFLPGESQGRGIPVGCRLWGHESQTRLKGLSKILFSTMVVQIYISTKGVGGFSVLHTLSSIYCLYVSWCWNVEAEFFFRDTSVFS